jgi:hypothetical protein
MQASSIRAALRIASDYLESGQQAFEDQNIAFACDSEGAGDPKPDIVQLAMAFRAFGDAVRSNRNG